MESVKQRISKLASRGNAEYALGLTLNEEFELACLRELVAVTEQRDALVVEMSIVKNDYATIPEVKCIGWPNTPNFDAAIAALRAEGVELFAKALRVPGDDPFMDAIGFGVAGTADNFARQLRESKGEVSNG